MTITFLELYNECAGQPWSMYDPDAESIDDLESALKTSINKAISHIWNTYPWSFRVRTMTLKVRKGQDSYTVPNGTIESKVVNGCTKYGVIYDKKNLEYLPDYDYLEGEPGEPEGFYIEGENLYVYPTPDDSYNIKIKYLALPYALNVEDEEVLELKDEDDYLDIPEKYEALYKNCIISLAMVYAIADESDENHSGYIKQYNDSLSALMKYCNKKLVDRNIVW